MPNSLTQLWPDRDESKKHCSLGRVYSHYFQTVVADTPDLQDAAHRLRYRIYCLENPGYENPDHHHDGRERDDYDNRSIHTLIRHKNSGEYIGVIRVVLPDKADARAQFPFQRAVDTPRVRVLASQHEFCEISRLGLIKDFRTQSGDSYKNHIDGMPVSTFVILGLVQGALKTSLENKTGNAFFIVEPKLLRALSMMGLSEHEALGEPVDYHGMRQAFSFNYLRNFERLKERNADLWSFMTGNGHLHRIAIDLERPQEKKPLYYRPLIA
ncbi:MAG: PEP-CTERM/exosortase system-associated acyltransferase [Micavibrio aeruginosavorus]|uniref:PEP-CTERM/exosortase system-associated acyltransferase n=1 Tax=Micavibrio aeruginosavorus TaxID=349221 RepID=A0A7T5UHS3_9BACT|nr:MAG: PEP-CTERM/exosortase system-associated acyltransferase [Micavibrio aeruginosavorus]